jgi:hypothetical protein
MAVLDARRIEVVAVDRGGVDAVVARRCRTG